MGMLKKRSTVLGLPIGRQRFSWSRLAGVIGTTVAVAAGFAAAALKGGQRSEQEGENGDGETGTDEDAG